MLSQICAVSWILVSAALHDPSKETLQALCLKMINWFLYYLAIFAGMSDLFCSTWYLKGTSFPYFIAVKSNCNYSELGNVQRQPTKRKAKHFKAGHMLASSALPAGPRLHLSLLVLCFQHNIRNSIPLHTPPLQMTKGGFLITLLSNDKIALSRECCTNGCIWAVGLETLKNS